MRHLLPTPELSILLRVQHLEKEVRDYKKDIELSKIAAHHAVLCAYVATNELKHEKLANENRMWMKKEE